MGDERIVCVMWHKEAKMQAFMVDLVWFGYCDRKLAMSDAGLTWATIGGNDDVRSIITPRNYTLMNMNYSYY
jgi:hypothetical protein